MVSLRVVCYQSLTIHIMNLSSPSPREEPVAPIENGGCVWRERVDESEDRGCGPESLSCLCG
jgi:hypothetical protein